MKLVKWSADDPEFARQQVAKLVESGELPREVGEELVRSRYEKNGRCDDVRISTDAPIDRPDLAQQGTQNGGREGPSL